MPPKRNAGGEKGKVKKSVDDKTFGMKNKKGSKAQKYVAQVAQAAQNAGKSKEKKAQEEIRLAALARKELEAKKKAELNDIFRPVQLAQKVPFGVDPKTILCSYFKQGTCQKGNRCKFSHDLNVERKAAKADIYTDKREKEEEEAKKQTMEDWDQDELEKAVQRHVAKDNRNKPTEIVCKYFLDAIESRKYGWFWECPNGDKCIYRHALPPGFVLKKKETPEERAEREARERANAISFEDFLEVERHKLGKNLTPVTEESFKKWKEERKNREILELTEAAKKKKEAYENQKAGMKSGGIAFSGRELFEFNPDLAIGDGDDDAMDAYVRENEDEYKIDRVFEETRVNLSAIVPDEKKPVTSAANEEK